MRAALAGFTVRFGAAIVLDRIDLSIAPGEITALIGESGCGKSLVASALCGLLPPGLLASGEVWIGDRALASGDAQWTSVRGHVVGLVPQSPATSFTPVRTIGAQMREVIDVLGSDRSPQELCAAAALDLEALELYPHELSGGMAQRAAVAAALVGDPAVLIADEPTSALDAQTAHQVLATLRRRADDGASVLVITHDLASVLAVGCDRIAVMRSGRIVAHGAASGPDAVTASASAAQVSGPDLRDYVRAFFEEVR